MSRQLWNQERNRKFRRGEGRNLSLIFKYEIHISVLKPYAVQPFISKIKRSIPRDNSPHFEFEWSEWVL